MTINWPPIQTKLGVVADGDFGPISYAALLTKIAGHAVPLAASLAAGFVKYASRYQVDANPERLAQFVGQCAHESGGFIYLREIWGPTATQRAYDAPGNHLGNRAGDGFKMRGAGLIEVTGRDNFTRIGTEVGLDLIGDPDLLNDPDTAVLISLEWWRQNNMNTIADLGDTLMVSRAVNLGNPHSTRQPNGYASRVAFTNLARSILT
jgi:putative chitinase